MAAPLLLEDTKRMSSVSSTPGKRYALVAIDDLEGGSSTLFDGTRPLNIISPGAAGAGEPRIIYVENPRSQPNIIVQAAPPAPAPVAPPVTKKKEPMHPLLKGLIVLTAGPFVVAGAMVVAAGGFVYGTGAVIAGVGDLMTGGPLKKKARRAWRARNAEKNARRTT